MGQPVRGKVLEEPKVFLTVFTLVGFLPRVNAQVFSEVALVAEALPAGVAFVGFLSGVDQVVFC